MKSLLPLAIAIFVLGTIFYFVSPKKSSFNKPPPTEIINNTVPSANEAVPLPTEEDIIRTFFNLINEKRIPQAINMMTDTISQNDSLKQQWAVTFNSWEKTEVTKIEPYNFNWTDTEHTYKVNFNLQITPGSENMWENGENIRFVVIVKQNNVWKIQGLATGP